MISKSKKKFILPKHVAIIMDGNNRWTKKHKLKGFKGHEKGIDAIQNAVDASKLYNIKFLTLFSFSTSTLKPLLYIFAKVIHTSFVCLTVLIKPMLSELLFNSFSNE